MYAISLLTVILAFLVCFFHAVFEPLSLVFTIPALLTTVYGDRKLTAVTCGSCILGKTVSDLFLRWDPEEVHALTSPETLLNFALSLHRPPDQGGNRQALRMAFQQMEEDRDSRCFLAMMDLDDFKHLNDTFGHGRGDRYLRSLGSTLLAAATDQAVPFRFGGDEFCVLFRDCQKEEVLAACRRIQEQFLQTEIHRLCRPVTVSIGVAEHLVEERPSRLLEQADAALYKAKQEKGSIWMES